MSSMEDLLFYTITEGQDMVPLPHFISVSSLSHSHTKDFAFSAPADTHEREPSHTTDANVHWLGTVSCFLKACVTLCHRTQQT